MAGGNILHVASLRIRVTGVGNLKTSLLGYDFVLSQERPGIPMKTTDAYEKVRLFNFISPETMVKFETTEKDEVFRLNRITVFVKQQWTEYPA